MNLDDVPFPSKGPPTAVKNMLYLGTTQETKVGQLRCIDRRSAVNGPKDQVAPTNAVIISIPSSSRHISQAEGHPGRLRSN